VWITVPRSTRGPPCREADPETKSSRSHHKISTNLTEICWRCLRVRVCYFVQITVPRSTRGPMRQESNPKTKSSRSHHLISTNLTKIRGRCLRVRACYFVRITVPRSTRGPRVESLKDRYGEPEMGGVNGSRQKLFSKEMKAPTRRTLLPTHVFDSLPKLAKST
jgi:hypothetical protein